MEVQYDGSFDLATGKNRKETSWKNKEWRWSEFLDRIKETHRTAETLAEYKAAKVDRQAEIKDIGGFVGGYIEGGRRKAGSISYRQLLTFDLDFIKMSVADLWDLFCMLFGCAGAIYSTHKHTDGSPRLRIIIPINRPVTPEEYIAIGRRIAGSVGIEMFDDSTFEPSRLMYWPSTSVDGTYAFEYQDGAWLDADEMLGSYKNWRDTSEWPVSSRINAAITHSIKKQGDPLEKPGLIGAFCRTYDIHQVIENCLADEYTACDVENRYTYVNGSTAAGLVVYEDKFAYSHHGTDPCSGKLCNAFDLVRLHKFGLRDENCEEKTPVNKLPSFLAMEDLVVGDKKVTALISSEKMAAAGIDFAGIEGEEEGDGWMEELDMDKKGNYVSSYKNLKLILENDPHLKGCFAINTFSEKKVLKRLPPWRKKEDGDLFLRDDDEEQLRIYLADEPWCMEAKQKISDILSGVSRNNAFHPVKEYFKGLFWDGVERLDTLFIDYLGAEDNDLNRLITRIAFTAAVNRIYRPGTKFDQITVLVGSQGCGKSTIIEKMSVNPEWFSNSMPSPDDPVKAASHLRGKLIIEVGELVGFRKAEVEAIKNFLSKTSDDFRPAWGKNEVHRPRQCIFFGSTNEEQFLRDSSGERRYWPVKVGVISAKYNLWEDLTKDVIGQLWAEAIYRYKDHQPLMLPVELSDSLKAVQETYKETDEWQGIIEAYLNKKLPTNWASLGQSQRRDYFLLDDDPTRADGMIQRSKVCVAEILNECPYLGIKGTVTKVERNRIAAVMRKLVDWDYSKNCISFGPYGRQAYWKTAQSKDVCDEMPSIF